MAQLNLTKLASQGRAYSAIRPWTEAELEALLAIEAECEMSRVEAAELIRNGVDTVEGAMKAKEAGFQPKTLETLQNEAVEAHKEEVRKELDIPDAPVVKEDKEPEAEAEGVPEVVAEAEVKEAKPQAKKKATKK